MSNSFYYFFSATPQVLGAVLALFAVVVIFKIQNLSDELLSIAKNILPLIDDLIETEKNDVLRIKIQLYRQMTFDNIKSKNIKNIKHFVDVNSFKFNDASYGNYKEEFLSVYVLYVKIKNRVLNISIITAITIILCIAVIPFGEFILCHLILLYLIFGITILSASFIFYSLYTVLKSSLD